LSQLLWDLGVTETGQVNNVERITILFPLNYIAVPYFLFSTRLVIYSEKVELLCLAWSFTYKGNIFPVGDLQNIL
jgi:hypothetical protein